MMKLYQNFKPINDWLKTTVRVTANLISDSLQKKQQEKLADQQAARLEISKRAAEDYMHQIHPELAYMFRQASISRLRPVQYLDDILTCGYTVRPDFSVQLYFLWTKANPEDVLASAVLDSMIRKMNLIIKAQTDRYKKMFEGLNDYGKAEFMWDHPYLNYGFHVVDCKDNGDDILIEVALGFPV